MQVTTISERELVKKSMEELCLKEGFADPKAMVQRNLEFLTESIESKTGVLISLSTIKRLINGEFSRLPQIATLNAIAVSLGYDSWQVYKLNKTRESQAITPNKHDRHEPTLTDRIQTRKSSYKRYFLSGGLTVFATLGLLAILNFENLVWVIQQVQNFPRAKPPAMTFPTQLFLVIILIM